ncbi:MAG: hypothetical protein KatS3mg010_0045 [Acidimicrobiia bacterium]|nr:MAG: hypothetical protein KatS3mg010_0045 [Acidimicrobiia bacterium]
MRYRVGLGFDVHPFGTEPGLVLGGVHLDGAPRLAGHSDGDAVAHAVADALLGAAGLPDLGTLFPASDDRYRDADSMGLLREVAERVARGGWWVDNVDVVIAAETPRLGPHVDAMGANLVAVLAPAARADGARRRRAREAQARGRARCDRPLGGRRRVGGGAARARLNRGAAAVCNSGSPAPRRR